MAEHMELLGADYCEHLVFHPGCGVTRAVSVLGHVPGIRWAPGHVTVVLMTRDTWPASGTRSTPPSPTWAATLDTRR